MFGKIRTGWNCKGCVSKVQIFASLEIWILLRSSSKPRTVMGMCEDEALDVKRRSIKEAGCMPLALTLHREVESPHMRFYVSLFFQTGSTQPTLWINCFLSFPLAPPGRGSKVLSKSKLISSKSTLRGQLIMAAEHTALIPKILLGKEQLKVCVQW